jgi:hypothetical protein
MTTEHILPIDDGSKPTISSCPDCLKPLSFIELIIADGKGHCCFCGAIVVEEV